MTGICPNCGTEGLSVFYELQGVPAHDVLLMPTREIALNYPKGDIELGFCHSCGFVFNAAFDPNLHEYSPQCEETQGFSPTFSAFHQRLAAYLIDRHDLHDKVILEIGCGKGEFLTLLCTIGGNRGIGFDPAYVSRADQGEAGDRVTFIKDFYSEEYSGYQADFVCCKMTLEHIQHPARLVSSLRSALADRSDATVFFQVPDVMRVLRELAFWDVFYEHCSYFSLGSLGRLFRRCGFDVLDLKSDYGDQYLMIEARPSSGKPSLASAEEDDLTDLIHSVGGFSQGYQQSVNAWQQKLNECWRSGRRAVIWGGGSKAVAFLTTLGVQDEVQYVVDINPYRQGTYVAGTGQEIVAPEFLRDYRPDVVIVMNPVYRQEIHQELRRIGLEPELSVVQSRC